MKNATLRFNENSKRRSSSVAISQLAKAFAKISFNSSDSYCSISYSDISTYLILPNYIQRYCGHPDSIIFRLRHLFLKSEVNL